MFERTLQDVVKGLRAQPTSEGRTEFASMVLQECRKEMASTDGAIKANAVLKVAHLRMLGYDDRNCGDDNTSFHVIETMSLSNFKQKRIGYLAASTVLTSDSPVLLLATNSLKKELQSPEMYAVGLALGSTSSFTSRDLARDLLPDVIAVMTSSIKPYVRKRGTLCLYRLCTRYPEGLREGAYDALRSRLDDSDNAVVSCAVNAVCELARANPRNVLPLTPQLYQLLTTSGNNWLTIKVVKLYSSLLTGEPRLAKKLLDPLGHIIKTTSAKSLLYECISTVTKALRYVAVNDDDTKQKLEVIVHLCAVKLKEFVRDADQNLKYLGLVGFVELTKSYPYVAQEHKDLVLLCLNDEDVTVRLRALELLAGMANKNTVAGIVSRLLEHLSTAPPGKFRDAVVQTCIDACVDEEFQRVPSCEWLVAVLMDLVRLGKGAHGVLLAKQIVNVAMRVASVREFAANACARLLLFETESHDVIAPEVLGACAFVACEYFPIRTMHTAVDGNGEQNPQIPQLVQTLLAADRVNEPKTDEPSPSKMTALSADVRCVFILNAFKLAIKGHCEDLALQHSEQWLSHASFRIRERTSWCQQWCRTGEKSFILVGEPLGPVHAKSQKRVPLPPGLDLSVRKGIQRDSISKPTAISFRGRQHQQVRALSSSGSERQSLLDPNNVFQPFKSQDPSPFLLGSSATKKKENGNKMRREKVEHEPSSSSSSGEEDETQRKKQEPSAKLWSSTLMASVSTSKSAIVIAPSALPSGALDEEDDKESERNSKKSNANGGVLTLADIDVLDETEPLPSSSPISKGELHDGKKPKDEKKTKKKKEKKEKKEKREKDAKKKAVVGEEEKTAKNEGNTNNGTAEADLLDLSSF